MKKLTGNTFNIKDQLKAKGGKWNADEKCWYIPDEYYEEFSKMKPKKILNGQLWEECTRCGQEPVYLSLNHMCERCG